MTATELAVRQENEKRMAELVRQKERMHQQELYSKLLDAWNSVGHADVAAVPASLSHTAETLREVIQERIERHKKMIATLEWFSAHVALDNPEVGTLVTRVILEGLRNIESQRNSVGPSW